MRHGCVVVLGALAAVSGIARASPPPPGPEEYLAEENWHRAESAARPALEACDRIAIAKRVFGEVTVYVEPKARRWRASSSRSLGPHGATIEACVRHALQRHVTFEQLLAGTGSGAGAPRDHSRRVGTPVSLLPPSSALLPVWRRVHAGGSDAAAARAQLAKLLPPDYRLTAQGCAATERAAVRDVELLWLPSVGPWVPREWNPLLSSVFGATVQVAMWDSTGALLVRSERGLCLELLDATRQRALRAGFDRAGTCWAGGFEDILLRPRIAFPADRTYASVSAHMRQACALTKAGEVVCCGAAWPVPAAPPSQLRSLVLGNSFACGLDARSGVQCWGLIPPPPAGSFTRLSAEDRHVCGVRTDGRLACWGDVPAEMTAVPAGKFIDVAAGRPNCGVRADGRIECVGRQSPPGKFTRIAAGFGHRLCGLQRDDTLGCVNGEQVDTPIAHKLKDLVVGSATACGRRRDDTVACWTDVQHAGRDRVRRPPPAGKLVQIAGYSFQFFGVRPDGGIEIWGEPWPSPLSDDDEWPGRDFQGTAYHLPALPRTLALRGRIVDEWGAPLAGAEVLLCLSNGPCSTARRDAMGQQSTLRALLDSYPVRWPRDEVAFATTDRDGRWSAALALGNPGERHDVRVVVAAPGREVVERNLFASAAVGRLAADIALRPASRVDIQPMCGAAPCTGDVQIRLNAWTLIPGTHIERLPPGSYKLHVQAGPMYSGTALVNATHAGAPQRVRVVLQRPRTPARM